MIRPTRRAVSNRARIRGPDAGRGKDALTRGFLLTKRSLRSESPDAGRGAYAGREGMRVVLKL
jgi:hypothetical protein